MTQEGIKACPGLLDRNQLHFHFPPASADTDKATAIHGELLHKEPGEKVTIRFTTAWGGEIF